jgi:type IX secretion system PorP/SprF family membrane protein
MKKYLCIIYFLFLFSSVFSQQLPQYTQFIFNKTGYNPAAAGTSLKSPMEIIFGGRTQWIGLNNNPKTAFLSANYTFIPQRSYRNWHNAGVYIDQDRNGAFVNNTIYLSYAFHQMITKKTVMSVGVFAGMRQFSLNTSILDRNDPAVMNSSKALFAYPDIIPGIRIYNRNFFADLSLWQLTIFQQKGYFSSSQIGSPSKLPATFIFTIGKKFNLPLDNKFLVSVNVKGTYKSLPLLELNLMNYWNQRFAYGVSLRGIDFVSGIFQLRIVNNFVVGFAYDMSINRMFHPAVNSVEVMIGVSPVFGNNSEKRLKSSVDDCSF